jgi:hypothetical protein
MDDLRLFVRRFCGKIIVDLLITDIEKEFNFHLSKAFPLSQNFDVIK